MKKFLITLAVLAAAAFPSAIPVVAHAGDNTAIAINTRDGKTVYRIAFKVTRTNSEVVTTTNMAVAFSSCTDCQAVAIAFQTVLVMNSPTYFAPENVAFAFNLDCTDCVSVAQAYQFNVTTGGPVHFTADGNQELVAIKHDLKALKYEDLSLAELQARLDALAVRLSCVIANELVPAGNS